jgi:hypothetical protein
MCNNKFFLIGAFFLLASFATGAQGFTSQPSGRGNYAFVAYASGGAGIFASKKGAPAYLQPEVSRMSPVTTLRILWHPDHLLRAGLESGYVTFYSYKLKDTAGNSGRISLNAVPVLLEWSMAVTKHFNIFAGSGAYLLNTKLDYFGKTTATKFSVGWMAAASYIFPLSTNTGLGVEAKWLYAAETSNGSVCLQLQYVWKFLKW